MVSHVAEKYEDKKNDLVVKEFLGVNTQAARTALQENEFAWLENLMPIGYANLKAVPHQGASLATVPSGTLSSWKYVNLNNTDYLAMFCSNGAGYLLNLTSYAFTTIGGSGTFTPPVACAQWENDRLLIVDAVRYYSFDLTTLLKNGFVESVTVTNAGSGYTAVPTVSFTGGGAGATAVAAMTLVGAQTITAAGLGYAVGDVLTLAGGTSTETGQLRVDTIGGGGTVTAVSIYRGGLYTVLPASPNTVAGGSGTGCTITPAYGIGAVNVTSPGTTAYSAVPTVSFSSGAATATAVLLDGPDGGTQIATFAGRVWVFNGRTITYSAPASFVDFTVASAGGSVVVTDETLKSNITGCCVANNFLYYWGNSSIAVISDVRVVPGTPYVTVFSNTNVSPSIGSTFAESIFPYYRNIGFATPFGFYALVGATPQKISDHLDGVIDDIDFTQTVSGGAVTINKILCMAFCFQYDDPETGDERALLAIFFNKKWFFASQGDVLSRVAAAFQSGSPVMFATNGSAIYKLFSDSAAVINTRIVTPLWPMKMPTATKQMLKCGIELRTSEVLTSLDVQVDTDTASYPLQLSADNLGQWVNAAGVVGQWTNGNLGDWVTTGFQIFQGNIESYGRYVGYTVTSESPAYTIEGLLGQYERKAQWATKPS